MNRGYLIGICGVIVLSFAILMIGFGNAAPDVNSCPDNQTILSLFSMNNSHVSNWSDSNYPYKICFKDIFGWEYAGDQNSVHDCAPGDSNKVVGVYQVSNSHALFPPMPLAGTFNLCYGNLSCTATAAGQPCSAGYNETLALTGILNAHAAAPGEYTPTSFPIKICCKEQGLIGPFPAVGDVLQAYWASTSGTKLDANFEVFTNNTVKLVAETNAASGSIKFDIYGQKNSGFWIFSSTGYELIKNFAAEVDGAGKAVVSWKISDTDVARMKSLGLNYPFLIMFNASSYTSSNISDLIKVNDSSAGIGQVDAIISNPIHRHIYYVGVPLNFTDSSTSSSGQIPDVEWSISDDSLSASEKNSHSFLHTFTNPGNKVITLAASGSGGNTDFDRISILVLASPGINVYINDPYYKQEIVNNSLRILGKANVVFDGSDSYAVNSTSIAMPSDPAHCTTTVECLFGNCPATTDDSPSCALNSSDKIPVNPSSKPFSLGRFEWTGSEGQTKSGFGNISGTFTFTGDPGTRKITLNSSYLGDLLGLSSKYTQEFRLVSQCNYDGSRFYPINPLTGGLLSTGASASVISTSSNITACRGPDGIIGGGDDCCPKGQECTSRGCSIIRNPDQNDTNVTYIGCASLRNQADCNNNDKGGPSSTAAQNDPQRSSSNCGQRKTVSFPIGGIQCYRNVSIICSCGWNNKNCALFGENTFIEDSWCDSRGPGTVVGICSSVVSEFTEGAPGVCTATSTETCISGVCDSDCGGTQTITVPCGSPTIEMPLFGSVQFIIAAGSFVLIYLIFAWARKKG